MIDDRTNLWAFIIYPGDSAPDNYLNIIDSWRVPCAISPLHDPDEEEKKDHRHVMIYFGQGQKKSYDQVMSFGNQVKSGPAMRVSSRNGMLRYFIHFDNPEKQHTDREDGHEWTEDDLTLLSGFQIEDAFGSFKKDEQYYSYIERIIFDNKCVNIAELVLLLKETNCVSELRFLRRHTYYFDRVCDGQYKRLNKKHRQEASE